MTLSEQAYRSYFEPKYGEILQFEKLPGQSSAFILFRVNYLFSTCVYFKKSIMYLFNFQKVDAAVACRNIYHCIDGTNVHALPPCTPGALYQPDRSTMYRVEPKLVRSFHAKTASLCFKNSFIHVIYSVECIALSRSSKVVAANWLWLSSQPTK